MEIFYFKNIKDGLITLPEEESRHISKVMRKNVDESILITDGKGNIFNALIMETGKYCVVNASFNKMKNKNHNYYLHIAIAPTKMMERFEFIIEKCMEIGIDEITPILCEHSERKIIRIDRMNNIAIAAMKQSGNLYLPIINELTPFENIVKSNFDGTKCIAHCENEMYRYYYDIVSNKKNLILIGPEGDFSHTEVKMAIDNNFIPVSLGNSILRVETAAIIASSMAAIKNYKRTIL